MNDFNKTELTAILGFYYFDSKKNSSNISQKFAISFNNKFNKSLNDQTLLYYCSLFKNIDSVHRANPIKNQIPYIDDLWKYYIKEDRLSELKKFYKNFKTINAILDNTIFDLDEHEAAEALQNNLIMLGYTFYGDKPKEKYEEKNIEIKYNIRDLNVSFNALKLANFQCEVSKDHETFMRKNSKTLYSEGHHLIPLKFQNQFDVNLDVEANIVSLCSNCHNLLHYGKDYEILLRKLFNEERKNRLMACGIKITIEELIKFY